jgi:hypothetical protein
MEPLVFEPDRSRTAARRVFGSVIGIGGGGMGCLLLLAGLFMIPVALEGAKTNTGALWLLMFPVAGLLFLVVGSLFGGMLWSTGAGERIVVDAEAITRRSGKATTRLPFREIASLNAIWVRDSPRAGHWVLVISTRSGDRIDLGLAQDGYLAVFDVQAILAALLPRLSATAQIDPRIRAYASTGTMQAAALPG